MPTSDKFFVSPEADGIEPVACTIPRTSQITGESRSTVYGLVGEGVYEAVKSGRRTLIIYESIKRRFASLPRAVIKPPRPRPPRALTTEAPRRGRKPKAAVSPVTDTDQS
jgi:hypothetical protein